MIFPYLRKGGEISAPAGRCGAIAWSSSVIRPSALFLPSPLTLEPPRQEVLKLPRCVIKFEFYHEKSPDYNAAAKGPGSPWMPGCNTGFCQEKNNAEAGIFLPANLQGA